MRRAGCRAAGTAALLLCALLKGNTLNAQAGTLLMEDGTLFDPTWFREQYPEAEGSRKLAHKTEPEEETPEENEAAGDSTAEADSREQNGMETSDLSEEEQNGMETSDLPEEEQNGMETSDLPEEEQNGMETSDLPEEEQNGMETSDLPEEEQNGMETSDLPEEEQNGMETSDLSEEKNLMETADLSDEELYRLYQLYGQRDGLLPRDPDAGSGILLHEQQREASRLKASKDKELGTSWETITAEIYDTDTVHVWNTEYLISSETSRKLEKIIEQFEKEGYEIGFVMVDITTGDAISYHAGAEIYSASVIKAPYIFSLLEDGVSMTRDMYLAGNQSDNDAYVRIRSTYGNQVFADWLEGTGVPAKQSETRYIMTTPLDLCRMFYKGTGLLLGDSESSEWARTIFTDSLNSAAALTIGAAEDKKVYSKAGWIASTGNSIENSYTNGAVVDGEYPYVVTVMSDSLGYIGIEYAEELMPILDEIHDEMVNPQKAVSTEVTAGDISDFAHKAQGAAQH